jgi:uncharacterized membrane protein
MRVTLFTSLAVNLLILGAVAGFFVFGAPDHRADRDRIDFGLFYTRALSEEDRRALRRDFVAGLERQGRDRGAFLADMRDTLDAVRARPFDTEAFVSAMAEQSDRRARREEMGRQALANRLAAMSDEERIAYADRIEDRLSKLEQRIKR